MENEINRIESDKSHNLALHVHFNVSANIFTCKLPNRYIIFLEHFREALELNYPVEKSTCTLHCTHPFAVPVRLSTDP